MKVTPPELCVMALACLAWIVPAVEAAPPAGRPASPAKLLAKEIPSVNIVKTPLLRVLNQYGKLSGLQVQADWNGLAMVGIAKETRVTVKAQELSVAKLLDLTLDSIAPRNSPLAWYLSDGVVHVTTQMRALLRKRVHIPSVAGVKALDRPRRVGAAREISFNQTPLKLALGFLRDLSGTNFHVNWRALESVGITRETPVTVQARGISVARAMDLVLDQLNVGKDRFSRIYWIVEGGIVKIATGEIFNQTTKVRVYLVGDLLMTVPDFKGPRINLNRNRGTSNNTSSNGIDGGLFGDDDDDDDEDEETPRERREKIQQTLIETIKMSIGEDMWAPQGKGSIKFLRDKMIISQTPLGFKLLEHSFSR